VYTTNKHCHKQLTNTTNNVICTCGCRHQHQHEFLNKDIKGKITIYNIYTLRQINCVSEQYTFNNTIKAMSTKWLHLTIRVSI